MYKNFIGSRWIEQNTFEYECGPFGRTYLYACITKDKQRIATNSSIEWNDMTLFCEQTKNYVRLYSRKKFK